MDHVICPKCKKQFLHDTTPLTKNGYQFIPCPHCGYSITAITKDFAKAYVEPMNFDSVFDFWQSEPRR